VKPVQVESHVESWLSSLLAGLQYSVQSSVATAAGDVADEQLRIGDFLHSNLTQVITPFRCIKTAKQRKEIVALVKI